ncbi:MAG: hypothetical protein LBH53_00895 [Puniceicoccales bacterium]|nr:hypothetical protein [Puniceicoccales bacterium]
MASHILDPAIRNARFFKKFSPNAFQQGFTSFARWPFTARKDTMAAIL